MKLREVREAKGLSRAVLAERAGVHVSAIGRLENGRRGGTLEVWLRIAAALETPLTDLVEVAA